VLNFAKPSVASPFPCRRRPRERGTRERCVDGRAASVGERARVRAPSLLPTLTVHVDQEKVLQILLIWLSNAIKFTDSGGRVTLVATSFDRRRRAEDATLASSTRVRRRRCSSRWSDTGRGIASDQLARSSSRSCRLASAWRGRTRGPDSASHQPRSGERDGRRPHRREHARCRMTFTLTLHAQCRDDHKCNLSALAMPDVRTRRRYCYAGPVPSPPRSAPHRVSRCKSIGTAGFEPRPPDPFALRGAK